MVGGHDKYLSLSHKLVLHNFQLRINETIIYKYNTVIVSSLFASSESIIATTFIQFQSLSIRATV